MSLNGFIVSTIPKTKIVHSNIYRSKNMVDLKNLKSVRVFVCGAERIGINTDQGEGSAVYTIDI